jgi:hypothetical protein
MSDNTETGGRVGKQISNLMEVEYERSFINNCSRVRTNMLGTVAARSKAWNVFARSNAWDRWFEFHSRYGYLCISLFCVCIVMCVDSGRATGCSSPSRESYRLCKKKDYETEARAHHSAVEPLMNEWMNEMWPPFYISLKTARSTSRKY